MRIEKDSIGEMEIPDDALYGIHTARANENFQIIDRDTDYEMIQMIALIKKAAAVANGEAGILNSKQVEAISWACDQIMDGRYLNEFSVDALQGGAGTSVNMSANEIIANIALKHLGLKPGEYSHISPINHVNVCQSTNDVIPSAGRLSAMRMLKRLISELELLAVAFENKGLEYKDVVTVGRTQLQDAVPMTIYQRFHAYVSALKRDINRLNQARKHLSRLNMGATAIGSGINASQIYLDRIIPLISEYYGEEVSRAEDMFDATQNADEFVEASGAVKCCAVSLSKIASDLRLLSSGPKAGFSELRLPARQNGSSIMPGKINPVIPEIVNQAAFLCFGHDQTITFAAASGQLELNAFDPVILDQLFEEIKVLTNSIITFRAHCVEGIAVRENKCRYIVDHNATAVTALNQLIGYEKAAEIAKRVVAENKTLLEVILEMNIMSEEEFRKVIDFKKLTHPFIFR